MTSTKEIGADVLVVGGGLGGVAAALAAVRHGRRVVLTEPTTWLGGQLTSQAVPPDEHPWIEMFGCTASYRRLRDAIREHYRTWYPLRRPAREDPWLNPGRGKVSRLCHEPRVAAAVLDAMVGPYQAAGRLTVLRRTEPVETTTDGDVVTAVRLRHDDGTHTWARAPYVIDATELGDLLPLAGIEHVTGFESRAETGEPSAPDEAQPDNVQAMSWVFALEHREGENHVIERPERYDYFRSIHPPFWPAPLLSLTAPDPRTLEPLERTFVPNGDDAPVVADQSRDPGDRELWAFRRILARSTFEPGFLDSDVTIVNWPMIDYLDGHPMASDPQEAARHIAGAYDQARSFLYYLQTEAPRADGGTGFPGLRPRPDVMGSSDGFALAPYIREGRRIKALTTVVEQDVSFDVRGDKGAVRYPDTVGVGMYRIDLHPSTGGDNYIDVASTPFYLPLGALIPQRVTNVLAGAKNIGTTHLTNGCYRLHPVEWNAGEVAGLLAAHCLDHGLTPHAVHADADRVAQFQAEIVADGIEIDWPTVAGY